ncbi:hypothetical protein J1N35_000922 [Gossypium stocksii]|uniref:Retrovirus-related Pol polyprotein from transposon TNT 1-94-like beta-barrel domain-containing protein n=1 Tax=Gossypium stocksii TaxID=47602 RepID=A0A9D4ALG9_9ROSI|nr:hypothetical protein J1N35_000922 [Gossypium stocksii]
METPINAVEDMDLCDVISEVNMVDSTSREWWIDTGATRQICSDKDSFSKLECENGEKLYIGNAATSKIKRKGIVVLKMTSGKELKVLFPFFSSQRPTIALVLVFVFILSLYFLADLSVLGLLVFSRVKGVIRGYSHV